MQYILIQPSMPSNIIQLLVHLNHKKLSFFHLSQPNRIHYPSLVNWSHNVTGADMKKVLDRKGNQLDYWSSYARVHNKLGLERGEGVPKPEQPKMQYNLITGKINAAVSGYLELTPPQGSSKIRRHLDVKSWRCMILWIGESSPYLFLNMMNLYL